MSRSPARSPRLAAAPETIATSPRQSQAPVSFTRTVQKPDLAPCGLDPLGKIPNPDPQRPVRKNSKPRLSDTPTEPSAQGTATEGAGLRILYRAIAELRPFAQNSRTHSAKQIAAIEQSLLRYGWTTPILIADDTILAGHARLEAASVLAKQRKAIPRHRAADQVPTLDLSALSADERRAYVIADNALAEKAGWDKSLLRLEIEDLAVKGFDLSLTGFTPIELSTLRGKAEQAEGPVLPEGLRYQVLIDCADEGEQSTLLAELATRGLKARPLIL